LATDLDALRTFSFLTLLDFALFSLVSIRERRAFWSSMPSKTLLVALLLDGLIGIAICTLGVTGLQPIPLTHALAVLAYSFIFALLVNDLVKRRLVRWLEMEKSDA
jgi:membrane protein YdbS with pleckstrin-like domain